MSKYIASELELLVKIADKVESLNDKLHKLEVERVKTVAEINSILHKQEANLAEHMKRTAIAEANISILTTEMRPIIEGLSFFKTFAKVISFLGGAVAAYFKFKR
jgi:hypothetical protein